VPDVHNTVISGNLPYQAKKIRRRAIMSELSIHELETQHSELLPEREALGGVAIASFNTAIFAANSAQAVQALTLLSKNTAVAVQTIYAG
jgi:hypothetical protein